MALEPRDDDGRRSTTSDRFGDVAAAWLAELATDRTRTAYGGDLERFRTWLDARGVPSPLLATTRQVSRFRDALESEGEAASTMARRMSALRSFFRFATSRGEIARSPSIRPGGGTEADVPAGLGPGDVADLVDAAGRLGSRTSALVGLILFNGMRLDEVLASDVEDVRVRPGSTAIALPRRDGAPTMELDPWTAAAVRRYIDDRRAGPLLLGESPSRPVERLTRFGADYVIKRAGSAAGIDPPMSANTLRRTFVSRAHAAGQTMPEIRDRLGHRDVRTTMRHVWGRTQGLDGRPT